MEGDCVRKMHEKHTRHKKSDIRAGRRGAFILERKGSGESNAVRGLVKALSNESEVRNKQSFVFMLWLRARRLTLVCFDVISMRRS